MIEEIGKAIARNKNKSVQVPQFTPNFGGKLGAGDLESNSDLPDVDATHTTRASLSSN